MMSDDSNSPFDMALARPFLDEPARKKWSITLPSPVTSWLRQSSGDNKRIIPAKLGSTTTGGAETITFISKNEDAMEEALPMLPRESSSSVSQQESERSGKHSECPQRRNILDTGRTNEKPVDEFGREFHDLLNMSGDGTGTLPSDQIPFSLSGDANISGPTHTSALDAKASLWSYSLPPEQEQGYGRMDWDDNEAMMELVPLVSSKIDSIQDIKHSGTSTIEDQAMGTTSLHLVSGVQDGNIAIMTERKAELANITSSMRQIHTIQKDFASVVESQNADIESLSWNSIEAFGRAQSGLEHLVKTVKNREDRKTRFYSVMLSTAVVMAFCYVVAGLFHVPNRDESSGPVDPVGSEDHLEGSPEILVPIRMVLP